LSTRALPSAAAAAAAAGLGVGAFAFLDAALPPAAQANFLLQTVGPLDGIELAIDVESNAAGVDGTVTIPVAASVALAISNQVGFPPIYYGTRWGPDDTGSGLPNGVLAACPLWLAEYGNLPVCPAGWSQWTLWQHTNGQIGSAVVPVPGIGPCDRSYIAAQSLAVIAGWWGRRNR
jgi:lysozyme